MSVYELTLTLQVHADTAEEAREALGEPLDRLFQEPFVLEMAASKPVYVPVSGRKAEVAA